MGLYLMGQQLPSIVERARDFAIDRHGDQKYNGTLPYRWLIGKVAELAKELGYSEPVQAAAWLHDTIERTNTSFDEIEKIFGYEIAVMVDGVTYVEEDRTRGTDKLAKARSNPGSHAIKLCDASVNLGVRTINGTPSDMTQWEVISKYGGFFAKLQPDLPTPDEVEGWLKSLVKRK